MNKIDITEDKSLLLKNGKILDITDGKIVSKDILINKGKIVKLGKINDTDNYHIIDCKNHIITQSFIDIHTHFQTPGVGDQETLVSGSNAALSGGYSKVCIMPNTNPVLDKPELIDFILDEASSLPIDIYPIGAITKKLEGVELAEIGSMVNSGAVAISDAYSPIMNPQVMRYALEYAKMFDIPVINNPQDMNLVNNGVMNESSISNSLGLEGNPRISESIMINMLRGSGLLGLIGTPVKKVNFFRPLYDCFRGNIEDYAKKNNLAYCIDATNNSKNYFRNRVRLELIPLLEDYNPRIKSSIIKTSRLLTDDESYIQGQVDKVMAQASYYKNKPQGF